MVFELKITVLWFKGSATPLATEVGSLIKKVTLALRSHIRVFVNSLYFGCVFSARQKTVILPNLNVRPNPKLGAKLVITWGNEHV